MHKQTNRAVCDDLMPLAQNVNHPVGLWVPRRQRCGPCSADTATTAQPTKGFRTKSGEQVTELMEGPRPRESEFVGDTLVATAGIRIGRQVDCGTM
jgi:hypothetical protein